MIKDKHQRGNTLALVLICIGVIALLVAFFAINYSQILGTHKEAVTAIDAAALAAAKDMQSIVVDTPLGRVALADDVPAMSPPPGGKANAYPIIGLNTLLATLRLDSIIASKLVVPGKAPEGNTTILYAIKKDLALVLGDGGIADKLGDAIRQSASGGLAYNKYGVKVNMKADAQKSYDENKIALAQTTKDQATTVIVDPGYLNIANVACTTPTPKPSDSETSGQTTYKPYTTYHGGTTAASSALTFQFTPLASQLALIGLDKEQQEQFTLNPPASALPNLPPTIVRAGATQQVNAAANPVMKKPQGGSEKMIKPVKLEIVAFAQCGESQDDMTAPSGTMVISFASGGIPGGGAPSVAQRPDIPLGEIPAFAAPPAAPTRPGQGGGNAYGLGGSAAPTSGAVAVNFSSIATIASACLLNANSGASASTTDCSNDTKTVLASPSMLQVAGGSMSNSLEDCPWVKSTNGTWYKANGGPVPGSGRLVQSAFRPQAINQTNTNPSVALSLIVYDWLKSLGLRPNVTSVVNSLMFTDGNGPQSFYKLEEQVLGGGSTSSQYVFPAQASLIDVNKLFPQQANLPRCGWIEPAYAEAPPGPDGSISAMLNIFFGDNSKDPRYLQNMGSTDQGRQQANVWGYVPAAPTIAGGAFITKMHNGAASTVDGHGIQAIFDLWNSLKDTMEYGDTTQKNTALVVYNLTKQITDADPNFAKQASHRAELDQKLKTAVGAEAEQLKHELAQTDDAMNTTFKDTSEKVMNKFPSLKAALVNSRYAVKVVESMLKNMKALSGLGIEEVSPTHFIVAGADFYPMGRAATEIEVATGKAPSKQDPASGHTDWCTPITGNNQSQLNIFKHTQDPVIGAKPSGDNHWLTPAIAAANSSSNPYENLKFSFFVAGNEPGTGQIHMLVGSNQFAAVSTVEDQALYQNTQALITNLQTIYLTPKGAANAGPTGPGGGPTVRVFTVWQVQARDMMANAYSQTTITPGSTNADYFADMRAPGGAGKIANANWCGSIATSGGSYPSCPALVGEWQLTCPIPITTPPPPAQYHPMQQVESTTVQTIWTTCADYLIRGLGFPAGSYMYNFYINNMFALGMNPFINNGRNAIWVSRTTGTVTPAYWVMDGFYYYQGNIPGASWSGNGWSVRATPYSYTYAYDGPSGPVVDMYSS
jgi:hypothetical protein